MKRRFGDSTAAGVIFVLLAALALPLLLVGGILFMVGRTLDNAPGPYTLVFAHVNDECGPTARYVDATTGEPLNCTGSGIIGSSSLDFPGFSSAQNNQVRKSLAEAAYDGVLDEQDRQGIQAMADRISAELPPGTRKEKESGTTMGRVGLSLAGAGLVVGLIFFWRWLRNR
ncbi:hypothetical protein [Amycolatopsis sp. lyj-112]|uniref:hypothetical protein n=1 Tax=Amycolatopsis sp. lyj-112 TaxID=2789288 RepID=UPI00397D4332